MHANKNNDEEKYVLYVHIIIILLRIFEPVNTVIREDHFYFDTRESVYQFVMLWIINMYLPHDNLMKDESLLSGMYQFINL